MGLLGDALNDPEMGMYMGLLNAGGPSRMPVGLGQALAQGYGGYQQSLKAQQAQKMQEQEMGLRTQQMDQNKFSMAQAQDAAKRQEEARLGLKAYSDSLPDTSPIKQQIVQAVTMGVPMTEVWKKLNPEQKFESSFDAQGREIKGFVAPNMPFQQVGGAKSSIQAVNLGGSTGFVDPLAMGGQVLPHTQSPDSVASNNITLRGQNMTDARSREQNAQPIWDSAVGAFVTRPTAANPNGSAAIVPNLPSKPLTAEQSNSANFASRAARSNEILSALESGGVTNQGIIKSAVSGLPLVGGAAGAAMNAMPGILGGPNELQQQTEQARRDFVNAVLRKESGAAISPSEFDSANKQYFPQPGDSAKVIEQKRLNRELEIKGLGLGAGSGASAITTATAQGKKEGAAIKTPSKQITLDDGSKVLGSLGADGNYYVKKGGKTFRVDE